MENELEIDDDALTWLADAGYDQVYGARPLKRDTTGLENPQPALS